MKKILYLFFVLACLGAYGQSNSVERTKGIILDTLTTAQLNALPALVKVKGAYFHNVDTGVLVTWNGLAWVSVGGSGSSSDLDLTGNILTLTSPLTPGNQIDLSPYLDNTDVAALWANITGIPANLDLDSTDDFDGAFSSLTGIPAGLSDGDDDTIADGSETKVNAGTNVTVTGTGTTGDPYVVNSTASGGSTYTAGNGLNLNTTEFSVDSTRVVMLDVNSPILGPAKLAFGTNAALDLLPAAVGYKRFAFAIDGAIGSGTVTGNETAFDGWDKNASDDFDGTYASLTGKSVAPADIQDNAITTSKIANSTIQGVDILDGTIGVGDIANGAINNDKILDATITSAKFNSTFYVPKTPWTPTVVDGGGGATYTPTSTTGSFYTKLGNQVTVTAQINAIGMTGTPSGLLTIENFPISAGSNVQAIIPFTITGGGSVPGFYSVVGKLEGSVMQIWIQTSLDGGNAQAMSSADLSSATIKFSGTYIVD